MPPAVDATPAAGPGGSGEPTRPRRSRQRRPEAGDGAGSAPGQAETSPPAKPGKKRRRRASRAQAEADGTVAAVPEGNAAAPGAGPGGEPAAAAPGPQRRGRAARRRRRRNGRAGGPNGAAVPAVQREERPAAPRPGEVDLARLAAELGLTIGDERWYRQAFYHASYVNERGDGLSSNERLEFLGDAVLDLAVGRYLFERYPNMAEGDLSRLRAAVVRGNALSARARAMGLGRYVVLGKGEEQAGGRERPALLADLFEALVGAIFLDQGLEAATAFVLRHLAEELAAAADDDGRANYKSMLQEAVQRHGPALITYHVVEGSGPDHAKTWTCEVRIDGRPCGRGSGTSKRQAEQEAAREALLRGWNPDA